MTEDDRAAEEYIKDFKWNDIAKMEVYKAFIAGVAHARKQILDRLKAKEDRKETTRWRKYPDEKPEEDDRYAIIYGQGKAIKQRLWIADWREGRWTSLLPDINITHWQPITLPETESKEI